MRAKPTVRRILLDMTPMIDVIMILLFGVMIHSVERTKADTYELRMQASLASELSEADRQAREELAAMNETLSRDLDALQRELRSAKSNAEFLQQKLIQQRVALSESVADLLQLKDAEKLTFELPIKSEDSKNGSTVSPETVYKAIKRIEEMKKIFTFVDLHIDDQDFLSVNVDARALERFPVRNRSTAEVEQSLRNTLESASFNDVVLLLFSYESASLDRTVETVEQSVDSLLSHYRTQWAGRGKQFRYGRVGLVESAPVTIEQGDKR